MARSTTKRAVRTPSSKSPAHKRAIGRGMVKARAARAARKTAEAPVAPATPPVAVANNDGRPVVVAFRGSNCRYTYRTRDESLAVGDYACVISPVGNDQLWHIEGQGYLSIVRITEARDPSPISKGNKAPKFVSKLVFPTS